MVYPSCRGACGRDLLIALGFHECTTFGGIDALSAKGPAIRATDACSPCCRAAIVAAMICGDGAQRQGRAGARDCDHLPLGSDGIIRGAQSIYHGGHSRAALLLHGLGDTPQSLTTLASRLAEAGWTVSAPLLPGHGRTLAQFSASGATQWVTAAAEAYNELARQHAVVVVCGQSMGALIAIELAAILLAPSLVPLGAVYRMPCLARCLPRGRYSRRYPKSDS